VQTTATPYGVRAEPDLLGVLVDDHAATPSAGYAAEHIRRERRLTAVYAA